MTTRALGSTVDYSSLIEVLSTRAGEACADPGYTFLLDGGTEEVHLTYGELDAQARAIAALLQEHGAAGERVLLLYPPGLAYLAAFFGCLYAGAVAVPAYPPRQNRSLPRLLAVVEDARPVAVLATADLASRAAAWAEQAPAFRALRWLTTDFLAPEWAAAWRPPRVDRANLAFLQYTSGSTGSPKGVMLSHGNLLENSEQLQRCFGYTRESRGVIWLPPYHDMGLIGGLLQPLYGGWPVTLMSPVAFLQRPARWLEAITRTRATVSGGPNFAYDLCVRRIPVEERQALDLASWEVAFNGAEPIRAETLERFAAAFGPCGFRPRSFYPCYGLAESTLIATGGRSAAPPVVRAFAAAALERHRAVPAADDPAVDRAVDQKPRRLVGCGTNLPGQELAVVDPETAAPCPPGVVGEIWLRSASVAGGYWRLPEETARTFGARRADGGGPYLRTGDLGFLLGGELFVTGRLKDLLILRGRNHYPQDVEAAVEASHPALRPGCSAAFAVEVESEEVLVVVAEVERGADAAAREEIARAIRRAVAEEHEVQVHDLVFLRPSTLPKTSSGKVQRQACRRAYLAGELAAVGRSALAAAEPAANEVPGEGDRGERELLLALGPAERQAALLAWLRGQAGRALRVAPGSLAADQPLTELGLDSLAAIELAGRLAADLGVELPLGDLLAGASLSSIAGIADGALSEVAARPPIAVTERAEPGTASGSSGEAALSHGQRALWFVERLAPGEAVHQIVAAASVRAGLDAAALGRALAALVERHPALRTTFAEAGGEPAQRVHARLAPDCFVEDARGWSEARLEARLAAAAYRPFDLERGPLVRLGCFLRPGGEQVLLFAIHHLIADFWSLAVLARELGEQYRVASGAAAEGRVAALAPLARDYWDHVAEEERRLAGSRGERLWSYWLERLGGELPTLDLALDRPRPAVQTYRGAARAARLAPALSAVLAAQARSRGLTLYTLLLAGFQALLHRLTGQDDLVVGSPTAGRLAAEWAGLVGYFVNPVALRADLTGDPPAAELLVRTRAAMLGALDHQDLPLALLVERLQPVRDPSRPPLFQAMFVLQKAQRAEERPLGAFALGLEGAAIDLGGLIVESRRFEPRRVQLDLTLMMAELDGSGALAASLRYNPDLFDAATVERLLGHFATLLGGLAVDLDRRLSELPLLSAAERQQLEVEWSADRERNGERRLIHELFEAQAARAPGEIAVVAREESLTYRELDRRASCLAGRLRQLGLGPEVRVAICVERSPAMVIGLLAILKAGGAYVPLDPAYPRERLATLLADSAAAVLLTQEGPAASLPPHDIPAIDLDRLERAAGEGGGEPLPAGSVSIDPDNLAYVIYTSGSTGRPKGVAITHGNAWVLLAWAREVFPAADLACVLASTSICFDVSVFELFAPLAWGGRLLLAADALELPELPGREEVTLLCTVPSVAAELTRLGGVPASVRTINLGGEVVPRSLVDELHAMGTVRRVLNLYGPSEDTTYSTLAALAAGEERAPGIGRPVAGTTAYVLGPGLEPLPIGAAGELHLGGAGLARGYLGRPGLTAERFVPDPWSGRPGGRFYRTGDLVRRRPSGELDFLGRIDQQVKVRGFRVEPGEIEASLAAHPAVDEAAVVVRGASLVAFVVAAAEGAAPAGAALREHLRARLPAYMVPAEIVPLDTMPRTPSGKLDRRALMAMAPLGRGAEAGALPSGTPRLPVEEMLAGIWTELLGVERVVSGDDFFALGGHSLLAARVVSRVHNLLGVDLPVRSLFETPTLASLAGRVERARGGATPPEPIGREPRGGTGSARSARLSFAQERLWFLDRLQPGGAVYNMPAAVLLRGLLAPGPFAAALADLARRHETLRTTFREVAGEPFQVIASEAEISLPLVDLAGLDAAARRTAVLALAGAEAGRPFDLRGPLLRAVLLRTVRPSGETAETAEHVALFTLHHIVSDGWSMGIFLRDLAVLYEAALEGRPPPLPELPVQYADYAAWQRRRLASGVGDRQLAYWRRRLEGAPASLDLPLDRPRPLVERHRGATQEIILPEALTAELAAFSRRHGATLFMTLLAAFQALLARATGEEDLLVGSPVANRGRPELEDLLGLFVNTLVFRGDLTSDPTFGELLGRVREGALAAYDHQELPFERLVEELRPERDLSRPPLVQVLFVLENAPPPVPALSGLALSLLPVASGTAKLDLTLSLAERAGELRGGIEYSTDLFDATTVARFGARYARLLAAVVADSGPRLSALPLLASAERQQLVREWNDTRSLPPSDLLVHRLVERQAARRPDRAALVQGDGILTYGELDRRADALARRLRGLGVGPERTVGLCTERSLEMVVAMLAILKAGGAYLPLDPAHPAPRLQRMLEDTGALVLVSQARLTGRLPRSRPRLVLLDPEPAGGIDDGRDAQHDAGPDGLVYVTYTSGSTGRPKGVGIPHRGVVRLVAGDCARFGPDEVFLQLSPIAFDTAAFEIWGALAHGATLAIMPAGMTTPSALADELARHRVTTLWLTAPLFHQMVEERLNGLAGIRQLLTGGDVVSPPHARRLVEALPSCRLIDGYGPTENSTFTCCFALGPEPLSGSVPIGRPIAGTRAYVLDEQLAPVPIGVAGELCAGGDGLARGYAGRPDWTAERFVPDPLGAEPGGRLYRTGDLARYLADGNVEFLGRRDRQVKLRGHRIEPGEIEAALAEHPAVAAAAVLLRQEGPGDQRLVAYLATAGNAAPAPAELRRFLAERLPDPMLPAAYVVLPALPVTAHGKVDRQALARIAPALASRSAAEEGRVPRTPAEQLLAGIWCELLPADEVSAEDDFFALGGHSLLATRLLSRVRDAFGVELPVRALFEHPRLAGLAAEIERALEPASAGPPPIAPLARPAAGPIELPTSFAQERLWFLDQLLPGSPVYAVPVALDVRGPLAAAALAAALTAVVRRHEALRTTFADAANRGPGLLQVVAPPAPFPLPTVDLSGLPESPRRAEAERLTFTEARRSFDLARGPLIRGTLLRLDAAEHSAVVNLHHAVCDGWSMGVLLAELSALYPAGIQSRREGETSPLPELAVQYADFAAWQRAWLAGGVLAPQLAYWRERLAGAPAALDLPADRPRPAVQSFRGAQLERRLFPDLSRQLGAAARRHRVTPFMVLLAGLQALLGRVSGQEDVLVGSPVANRRRPETEGLIGLFVNTLVLRGDLSGDPPAAELLARVRDVCLGAYAHQDLPFERLVEALRPERDLSRPALFSVLLVDQNVPLDESRLGELRWRPRDLATGTAKFDLTLLIGRIGPTLRIVAEHSTDLFDGTTVERLLGHFETLLAGLVADPASRLSKLPLLTAAERQQLTIEWNATGEDFRERRPIHELFAAQAARIPGAVALVAPEGILTYRELDQRAGRLAARLRELGVGPEARVGICADRSLAMVVGLLAILKAGGAYVPLDPAYPRERLAFLFADAGVAILLAQGRLAAGLPEDASRDLQIVDLDRLDLLDLEGIAPLAPGSVPLDLENLAYVIYTSGSTGRPKGVMNRHGGIANRLLWMQEAFRLDGADRVLQKTPFSFDVSVWELFWPLLAGARLVLARPGGHQDPDYLAGLIAAEGVTTVHFVPSMLQLFLESPGAPRCTSLRRVICSGEALSHDLQQRYYVRLAAPLYNLYGPTEAAVDVTSWVCDPASARQVVPIGRPIANLRVHLLDRELAPVPLGVTGEVFLGGAGLARGYLGRPDLTAERFVPDPLGEGLGARVHSDGALGARVHSGGALGARLYRTGDLGRRLSDGAVEYLGRTDFQVKVRGFRIELGEIEAALAAHPAVAQAVVTAQGTGTDLALVAYLAVQPELPPPSVSELRGFLAGRVPEYMLPAHFLVLPALPLSPNGKVDRAALPAPSGERPDLEVPYVEPGSELERTVAAVWRAVLALERVGRDDNFFALGGTSLAIARVRGRLRQATGRDLPLVDLFRFPTVGSLAGQLAALEAAGESGEPQRVTFEQVDERARRSRQAFEKRRKSARGGSGR